MASIAGPSFPPSSIYVPYAAANSRATGVNVAYATTYLILGTALALLGGRAWRLTCAVALGLAAQLVTAAVAFNVMGNGGLNDSFSDMNNDLALYGLITGLGLAAVLFSLLFPRKWYAGWWLGWLVLGPLAGISVAFTMMILKSGDGLLVDSLTGRWILIAVFGLIGLVAVLATKWRGATLTSALVGTWLLALGIDLIVNTNRGASLGLRKLLDENDIHATALQGYDAPLSTQLLFGLSWLFALLSTLLQEFLFQDRHFLQVQPSQHGRRWKLWFFPFLLRSRDQRGSSTRELDSEKPGEIGLAESGNADSPSPHSRQGSIPSSVTDVDQDLAERGSLASGSDLRALTRNYRRALEILESDDEHSTGHTRETAAIPIYYRPSPVSLMPVDGSPSPELPSPASPAMRQQERRPLLAGAVVKHGSPTSLDPQRSVERPLLAPLQTTEMEYVPRPRHCSGDQVPDLGAIGRAESDRGTTYSIPLTNITASEYKDRDNIRPPSWTGDLPWNPSMLRGPLDPATLPRHPPEEEVLQEGVIAPVVIRPIDLPAHAIPITGNGAAVAAIRSRSPEGAEDEYEIVNADEVSPSRSANVRISGPFQMPYPSRPGSRDGNSSPNPLASLGGTGRNILKVQRTPTREQHMFPAEDDLPDHGRSPEGHAGHSRLHTSGTAVEPEPLQRGHHNRDEDITAFEYPEDAASSHASYSLHNFKNKRVPVPGSGWRYGRGKYSQTPATPMTESSDYTSGQLPDRPITQSDLTPHLQDLPAPSRPVLVHNDSPTMSNNASLTGTPRSSTLGIFGRSSPNTAQLGSKSELSEVTVRPSQEQRRSMELEHLAQQHGEALAVDDATQAQGQSQSRKVRFVGTGTSSSGGRRTLRERLLRR